MLSLESFMLTEKYYNFFCIIKIPIHGIDSKGLGFVLSLSLDNLPRKSFFFESQYPLCFS